MGSGWGVLENTNTKTRQDPPLRPAPGTARPSRRRHSQRLRPARIARAPSAASRNSSPPTPPPPPNSPPGSKRPFQRASPSLPSPPPTSAASAPPAPSNASTRKSNAAPASPPSFQTKPPSCAWSPHSSPKLPTIGSPHCAAVIYISRAIDAEPTLLQSAGARQEYYELLLGQLRSEFRQLHEMLLKASRFPMHGSRRVCL